MKRLMFVFMFFVSNYVQAAEQQPSAPGNNGDAARLALLLHSLAGEGRKDGRGIDSEIGNKGAWQDVGKLVEAYSRQEPVKKISWWDKIFDWFAQAMAERDFSPEVGGHADLGYYKR